MQSLSQFGSFSGVSRSIRQSHQKQGAAERQVDGWGTELLMREGLICTPCVHRPRKVARVGPLEPGSESHWDPSMPCFQKAWLLTNSVLLVLVCDGARAVPCVNVGNTDKPEPPKPPKDNTARQAQRHRWETWGLFRSSALIELHQGGKCRSFLGEARLEEEEEGNCSRVKECFPKAWRREGQPLGTEEGSSRFQPASKGRSRAQQCAGNVQAKASRTPHRHWVPGASPCTTPVTDACLF